MTKEKKLAWALRLTVLSLATFVAQAAYADSKARRDFNSHMASVQQVFVDQNVAEPQKRLQRRHLAVTILHQLFDFQEMARRALGANARRYNDRLAEFTPLFVGLLEQAYIGKLEENGDAKIQYLKEIVDGQDIEVDTKTRLKDGSEYSVNYKLTFTPAGWRAYDVVVEGASLVNNYRSQFDRFLSKKSFDELLQVLREKKSHFS